MTFTFTTPDGSHDVECVDSHTAVERAERECHEYGWVRTHPMAENDQGWDK